MSSEVFAECHRLVDDSQLEDAEARWRYLQKPAQSQQHKKIEKKLRQYRKYWKLSIDKWTHTVSCQFNAPVYIRTLSHASKI